MAKSPAPKSNLLNWQAQELTKSIKAHYLRDNPPADEILIDRESLRSLDRPNAFAAKVCLVTNWGSRKEHAVNIRFKAHNFQIIPKSIIHS